MSAQSPTRWLTRTESLSPPSVYSPPRSSSRIWPCSCPPDEERIDVEWEKIWSIEPILFDATLLGFCEEAILDVAGTAHRLPSGPLHDAAEVARAGVPTVMLFVQSLRGLSHTKLEDTKEEHLELAVSALDGLVARTIDWVADGGGRDTSERTRRET